jgi:PKD repeat protein
MKKILLFLSAPLFALSQTCQDASVELSALVQNSPPQITLNWTANANATGYALYRKLKTATTWGAMVTSLPGTATSYTDNTVSIGVSYEYKLQRTAANFAGFGYINAGIEIPVIEQRGILILLVDSTFISTLSNEITRLINDFEGDGWEVIRHDINRNAPVTWVKSKIVADYNLDPVNTKAVFILGHVPVPYSGQINPDGHPDHLGAWPTDTYYGEVTSTWTDVSVNTTVATDPRNHNIPGDGKFDQSIIPSDLELQVGRVDFANMPAFTSTEEQLLRNYLLKDHDYRHKVFTALHRALVDDNFGFFGGESFAASGYKNFGPLVGPGNVTAVDYFTSMNSGSYLWSYGCGGGSFTSAGGIGTTTDFTTSNLQGVFTMLFGSYFGDWDRSDNFLRAVLAQGTTLTNAWSGRPHWVFHHMGLGDNIGYDVKTSINNSSLYFYNYAQRYVSCSFMGDPTLRNDVVAPAGVVVANVVGTNCQINWTASTDPVLGYYIYVKDPASNTWTKLNQTLVTGLSYTDTCLVNPGIYNYMVRAVLLETSPSGTYYNISQGISDTALNNNNLVVNAAFTTSGSTNVITFTNTSSNATSYQWNFGDAGTSTLTSPIHTYTFDGNYTVTLIATNGCDTDTFTFLVTIATGVYEFTSGPEFQLFPNPSTSHFTLVFDEFESRKLSGRSLKFESILGEIIFYQTIEGKSFQIDVSKLSPGIYLLSVESEQGRVTKRIVVSR